MLAVTLKDKQKTINNLNFKIKKIMKKLLFVAIVIFGFSAVSFGQLTNTAEATASATVY